MKGAFEALVLALLLAAAAQDFRDPSLKPLIRAMRARLEATPIVLEEHTPLSMADKYIINNPDVSDDMIRRMNEVTIEQVEDTPEHRAGALRTIPHVRSTTMHKFTVALMAGLTGIDADELSMRTPTMGVTGSAGQKFGLFKIAESRKLRYVTALHDVTDYLHGAGLIGLNRALWGVDGSVSSAIAGAFFGLRKPGRRTLREERREERRARRKGDDLEDETY